MEKRSTSDYYIFVGGKLATWRSKKQNVVAGSSAEAESRSVAHEICEVMWIKRFLEELKVSTLQQKSTVIIRLQLQWLITQFFMTKQNTLKLTNTLLKKRLIAG